ncbi:MAG: shikimate kinase [Patescibacteria group bacterium]
MNITLIGMPGAGKSSVGRILATQLGYEVVDFDREMEKVYKAPLQSLVDTWGDSLFIEREGAFAISVTEGRDNIIISPGGSIVYHSGAMNHLREHSSVAYLQAPLSLVEARIGTIPRGIIGLKAKTLADLFAERVPLYEHYAHQTFDANQDADAVANKIARAFS